MERIPTTKVIAALSAIDATGLLSQGEVSRKPETSKFLILLNQKS